MLHNFAQGHRGKAQRDLGRLLSNSGFQRMNAAQQRAYILAVMGASKFPGAGRQTGSGARYS
jgi:hypothetical protein